MENIQNYIIVSAESSTLLWYIQNTSVQIITGGKI